MQRIEATHLVELHVLRIKLRHRWRRGHLRRHSHLDFLLGLQLGKGGVAIKLIPLFGLGLVLKHLLHGVPQSTQRLAHSVLHGLVEILQGLLSVVVLLAVLVIVGKIVESHQQGNVALRTAEASHSWQEHGGVVHVAGLDERHMRPEELPIVVGARTEEGKGALVGIHRGKQQMIVELDVVVCRHHTSQLLQTIKLALQYVRMVGLYGIKHLVERLLCQELVALAALHHADVASHLVDYLVGTHRSNLPLYAQLIKLSQTQIVQLAVHQTFLHSFEKETFVLLTDLSLRLLRLIHGLVVHRTVVGGVGRGGIVVLRVVRVGMYSAYHSRVAIKFYVAHCLF